MIVNKTESFILQAASENSPVGFEQLLCQAATWFYMYDKLNN